MRLQKSDVMFAQRTEDRDIECPFRFADIAQFLAGPAFTVLPEVETGVCPEQAEAQKDGGYIRGWLIGR